MSRTNQKCRAANPSACVDPNCPEKRGVSHAVSRAIATNDYEAYESLRNEQEQHKIEAVVSKKLKDLNADSLTTVLLHNVKDLPPPEVEAIASAASWAAKLHRKDWRKNPVVRSDGTPSEGRTPYIVHPLRNTVRISRWGVSDSEVLVASLLHDTVEDHADDIAKEAKDYRRGDHEHNREVALREIEKRYGSRVRSIVHAVSNPILPRDMPREESNRIYASHVKEAIETNHAVFLVKFSDFVDNALSMHHNPTAEFSARQAAKYLPLARMFKFAAERRHLASLGRATGKPGLDRILERINRSEEYLARFV